VKKLLPLIKGFLLGGLKVEYVILSYYGRNSKSHHAGLMVYHPFRDIISVNPKRAGNHLGSTTVTVVENRITQARGESPLLKISKLQILQVSPSRAGNHRLNFQDSGTLVLKYVTVTDLV